MTLTLAAIAPPAASAGHLGHGDSVVAAVVTIASVVGVAHGSVAQVSVPKASLGRRKETVPGEGEGGRVREGVNLKGVGEGEGGGGRGAKAAGG